MFAQRLNQADSEPQDKSTAFDSLKAYKIILKKLSVNEILPSARDDDKFRHCDGYYGLISVIRHALLISKGKAKDVGDMNLK